VDTRHQTLQGVMFPLTDSAYEALAKFREKEITYVQLKIGKLLSPETILSVSMYNQHFYCRTQTSKKS